MTGTIEVTVAPHPVRTDGGVRDGALISVNGALHAVFSRLSGEEAPANEPARWFLEAGLGPCGVLTQAEQPTFGTLEEAVDWVRTKALEED